MYPSRLPNSSGACSSIFSTRPISSNFRLMASMRMIRMQIPMTFTYDYLSNQIDALLATTDRDTILKVKCTVYRNEGGLYTPLPMRCLLF